MVQTQSNEVFIVAEITKWMMHKTAGAAVLNVASRQFIADNFAYLVTVL